MGASDGYRLYTPNDEGTDLVLIRRARTPLTWRAIVADIREDKDLGLSGNRLKNIQVEGVDGFEKALLKMAWCSLDGPADAQLTFLMQLDDSTLEFLHASIGDFCRPDTLESIGDVAYAADDLSVPMDVMVRGIYEFAAILKKGPRAWSRAMIELARRHGTRPTAS